MNTHDRTPASPAQHRFSTVGFKAAYADLHRLSGYVFWGALLVSAVITACLLLLPITMDPPEKPLEQVPVVMLVESVPEITQRVDTPAPPAPFSPAAEPVPVDDIMPDDVTIEDTVVTFDQPAQAPVVSAAPADNTVGEIENEIFDYFSVEEAPERKSSVTPRYPPIAVRAGIGGTVTLKVLVNTEGVVDSVTVMDGPELLRESAVEAAAATTFTPARHNSRPVACWVILPFRFTVPN